MKKLSLVENSKLKENKTEEKFPKEIWINSYRLNSRGGVFLIKPRNIVGKNHIRIWNKEHQEHKQDKKNEEYNRIYSHSIKGILELGVNEAKKLLRKYETNFFEVREHRKISTTYDNLVQTLESKRGLGEIYLIPKTSKTDREKDRLFNFLGLKYTNCESAWNNKSAILRVCANQHFIKEAENLLKILKEKVPQLKETKELGKFIENNSLEHEVLKIK